MPIGGYSFGLIRAYRVASKNGQNARLTSK